MISYDIYINIHIYIYIYIIFPSPYISTMCMYVCVCMYVYVCYRLCLGWFFYVLCLQLDREDAEHDNNIISTNNLTSSDYNSDLVSNVSVLFVDNEWFYVFLPLYLWNLASFLFGVYQISRHRSLSSSQCLLGLLIVQIICLTVYITTTVPL